MSEIDVEKLLVSDVPRFNNSKSSVGISPVNAIRVNLALQNIRTRFNTFRDQAIAADDQNVKLTGDQTIAGLKTFQNLAFTASSALISDNFLYLNYGASIAETSGIVVDRGGTGTDASFAFNASTNVWDLLKDASTLSPLRLADPTAVDHAVTKQYLIAQAVLLTGAQTIAGLKTFSTMPRCSGVPSVNSELTNVLFVNTAIANAVSGLPVSAIVQSSVPDAALYTTWIRTGLTGNMRYYYSDGASWFPITTSIPRVSAQGLTAGAIAPYVSEADTVDIDVDDDFDLNNPLFTGVTASEYDGKRLTLRFIQDGTGGWTITDFGSQYNFSTDLLEVDCQLSPAADSITYAGLVWRNSSSKWDVVAWVKGFE